jgi:hypothetical protein
MGDKKINRRKAYEGSLVEYVIESIVDNMTEKEKKKFNANQLNVEAELGRIRNKEFLKNKKGSRNG